VVWITACFSPEEGNTLHHLVSKMLFLKKPVIKNPSVDSDPSPKPVSSKGPDPGPQESLY
jgi:hypothetical protein